MEQLRIGTLSTARITPAALIRPARQAPETVVTALATDQDPKVDRAMTAFLIDDIYRAAGLPPRP
jgi:hypothetical protein